VPDQSDQDNQLSVPKPDPTARIAPFCLSTIVDPKALVALMESARENNATSSYQDAHPWHVAQRLLARATSHNLRVPLLLAVEGSTASAPVFSHWATIDTVEILELSGKRYLSRIAFGELAKIPAIFEPLDSVFLKPADEQLERERLEGVRSHRHALSDAYIRPYAICETPGFISGLADWAAVLTQI